MCIVSADGQLWKSKLGKQVTATRRSASAPSLWGPKAWDLPKCPMQLSRSLCTAGVTRYGRPSTRLGRAESGPHPPLAVLQHDLLAPCPCSLCGHVISDKGRPLSKHPQATPEWRGSSGPWPSDTHCGLSCFHYWGSPHMFQGSCKATCLYSNSVTIWEGLPMTWASEIIYSVWTAAQAGTSPA